MLYAKTICPHCGNEISVNNGNEVQKCCWCRRLISVKLERTKKKKVRCEIEPMDFPKDQNIGYSKVKKSYNEWKDEEIYGKRH